MRDKSVDERRWQFDYERSANGDVVLDVLS